MAWFFSCAALLAACGDDDGTTPGVDGGRDGGSPSDGGPGDTGVPEDGGNDGATVEDGSMPDGDVDPDGGVPGTFLVDQTCGVSAGQVAVSPDGSLVATVRCMEAGASVWVAPTDGSGAAVMLAAAQETWTVEFTIDGDHVVYGGGGEWHVRSADASADAVRLATTDTAMVLDHVSYLERVSSTAFSPRILVMEEDGALRRIAARRVEDDYATTTLVIEDAGLRGDLSLLSASGRTLVARVDASGTETYVKLRTNAAMPAVTMTFGPGDMVMGPIGLGDTHNYAIVGDRLVRVELDTGATVELVPSGLLADYAQLFEIETAPGTKYVHVIVDGDPARRIREADMPIEVLATANANAHAPTPDGTRLVYASDDTLWAIPAAGGEPPLRVHTPLGTTSFRHAFSPHSTQIAFLVSGDRLVVAGLMVEDTGHLVDEGAIDPESLAWNGAGSRLLWRSATGDVLRVYDWMSATVTDVQDEVTRFWVIPTRYDVIVEWRRTLLRVTP